MRHLVRNKTNVLGKSLESVCVEKNVQSKEHFMTFMDQFHVHYMEFGSRLTSV